MSPPLSDATSTSLKAVGPGGLVEMGRTLLETWLHDKTPPLFFKTALSPHEQYRLRGKPRAFLIVACRLLKVMQARVIVEIGSMREPMRHSLDEIRPECCCDGHSTAFWAATGCEVHTVDINPACFSHVPQSPNVHPHTGDGVEFLRSFRGRIDFLYLDAWDVIEGEPYAEGHLAAYEAARPKLADTALVAIDDTDLMFGGKGRLAVPAMIRDGFELLVMARQTLLVRTAA